MEAYSEGLLQALIVLQQSFIPQSSGNTINLAVLIKAMQEEQDEIQQLKQEIISLRNLLAER